MKQQFALFVMEERRKSHRVGKLNDDNIGAVVYYTLYLCLFHLLIIIPIELLFFVGSNSEFP